MVSAPLRSVMLAVVTAIILGKPSISTPMCSFTPDFFFLRHSLFPLRYPYFGPFSNLLWSWSFAEYGHS
jgi:hypothetical protein